MRKWIWAGFLAGFHIAQAQYKVTFHITGLPAYNQSNDIYIAGLFNNWKPDDAKYRLQQNSITLNLPKGTVEYKFTRGSWEKAESAAEGLSINNRKANIESDTTIDVNIEHWADHFPKKAKQSTATKNVHILDSAFYIPQLDRHRRIWIYLPESYAAANKKYPVLYMQDGQNVFDDATSFAGEWGVDETLDTLGPKTKECIVVAIDNGGDKRMNEYCPYDMQKFGKGEGEQYVDFLVHTLKPFIDKHYRTSPSRKNTFIAGSSMGGLISFYAVLKYPDIFGGAGVFSPSFWAAPALKNDIQQKGKKVKSKIYLYVGKQEGGNMVSGMLAVFQQLHSLTKAGMISIIREDGAHSELSWRKEFPLFYQWLLQ